jgi:hypothetical protein
VEGLYEEELYTLYCSLNINRKIKLIRIRWVRHVARMGDRRSAHRVLMGRPEGKTLLGRLRCSWEDDINLDLQEVG